ncbi:tetratricopeptide repeat protein [Actinoplanes derwentensis]|uniref:Tetratricopeptide repeat-containing protein n=1 Tax=Actinoplanes derwentensis TaxID=113562 RepID=A0A1H2A7C5_9ACTN|nr:tetratricopeptide repeat protein [Actinoplanes derwentensis]SDT41773.1 Tetratricopeptide repeat-containing protein [Actinoplanes derwentensis]
MHTDLLLAEADALLARGRAHNAARLLAPFVGREPENVGGWQRMARARLDLGDPAEALLAAQAAWHLDPWGTESLHWLSAAHSHLGDHAEAIAAAAAACREDPGNPRLHNRLAQAQLAAGLPTDAAEGLRCVVDMAAYDADLMVTYAMALFAIGRPLSAREAVGRALAIDFGHAGARAALQAFERAMSTAIDAASLALAADEYGETLRIHPGRQPHRRPGAARSATGHVARVALLWFLAVLIGAGLLDGAGLLTVPSSLYFALLCAAGTAGCVSALAGPAR